MKPRIIGEEPQREKPLGSAAAQLLLWLLRFEPAGELGSHRRQTVDAIVNALHR